MENFVLGIFQEQLGKFIIGFKKEQVNANLLNGKGEITNVELNCAVLNDTLTKMSPFVELERVHCSKVSFHVTSWTNLRKAPIVVDVEHVTATLIEPLHYFDKREQKKTRQVLESELFQLIRQGLLTTRGPYNLFDRILDNISVEIQSVQVTFQTLGKFKTRRVGPWTPPAFELMLASIRITSVNEWGCEASPEECWRHNQQPHHQHNQHSNSSSSAAAGQTLMIFKKISLEYQLSLIDNSSSSSTGSSSNSKSDVKIPLVLGLDNVMEVQVALHRRVRDAALLAVQFDCVIPSIEVNLPQHVVPLLAHALAGLQYCLSKDRGFVDPLKTTSSKSTTSNSTTTSPEQEEQGEEVVFNTVAESEELDAVSEEDLEEDASELGGLNNDVEVASALSMSESDDEDDEDDVVDVETAPIAQPSSGEGEPTTTTIEAETVPTASSSGTSILPASTSSDGTMLKLAATTTTAPTAPRSVASTSHASSTSTNIGAAHDRPAILLPNGVVIHEKISMSLAIHHAVIRGTYLPTSASDDTASSSKSVTDGYIQLVSKGVMAEVIWPKENYQKGGYLQASVAYVSIQERYGSRVRTLLVGGVQREDTSSNVEPVEKATPKRKEVGRDETFPLYEIRSVRPDPINLRYTFPEQAFGLKTTVDYIDEDEDIAVLHEIGVEHIDMVIDSLSWCRAVRFALNENSGGFDPRWHSGDWSDYLTTDMILKTTVLPLNLEECIQPVKQLFLDENEFPSSDLFHVTLRVKKVEARLPAAILDDVRSCDIIFKLDEAMLCVSSALPRTFLSGKIGSSINGDDVKTKGIIDFPNDPSDVAYQLENSPDPADRQRGIPMSRAISTFRLQLTLRNASVSLIPIIPIGVALEPQELLAPTEITMIICFEGEPPGLESNLTKIVLFFSVLADRFDINFDFDLATSAIGTLTCHAKEIFSTFCACRSILRAARPVYSASADANDGRIIKSLLGRRVRVRQQISRSRETGGISIAFCLQVSGVKFTLWRQNVPYGSPLRSDRLRKTNGDRTNAYMPLLRLLCVDLSGIEVGLEASFLRRHRRVVFKLCLCSMDVTACNLSRLLQAKDAWVNAAADDDNMASDNKSEVRERTWSCHEDFGMVRIARLGTSWSNACADVTESVALRIEEDLDASRTWTCAVDLEKGSEMCCHVEIIEGLVLLVLESLLMPAWCKTDLISVVSTSEVPLAFPSGSVGDLLVSIVCWLRSLVPHQESASRAMPVTKEMQSHDFSGGIVDHFLRDLIEKVIPMDVRAILIRFNGNDMIVKVPEGASFSVGYGIVIEHAEFLGSYFASDGQSATRIMQVLGQKQKTWSSILPNTDKGLRQSVQSRQKLLYCRLDEETSQATETLVESFECGYSYFKSKAFLSMAKDIVVDNVERLDDFLTSLHHFAGACKELSLTLSHVLSTVRKREGSTGKVRKRKFATNPVEVACLSVVNLIQRLRDSQLAANKELAAHQSAMQQMLQAQQLEIMKMRSALFKKERDRLNAIALVSSQLTGWLRIGSSQRIGQRGIMTWNLFPKWAVLRRSLLLLYPSPTKPSASDVINMRGASLMALTGGRRHDIKRAFAIVESTGAIHLVVISTDNEYTKWVYELQKVTLQAQEEKQLGDSWRSQNSDVDIHDDGCDSVANQEPVSSVGRRWRFARAVKASSQTVLDRGRQSQENKTDDVQDKLEATTIRQSAVERGGQQGLDTGSLHSDLAEDTNAGPSCSDISQQDPSQGESNTLLEAKEISSEELEEQNRRLQLRTRFAGVSQATRSRFGSAFQAARQKGRELRLGSGASTPLGGSRHGTNTPLGGSSHGTRTPLSGSSHGMRGPLSNSTHGVRTALSVSSHGLLSTLAERLTQESSEGEQAADASLPHSLSGWWSCTKCRCVNKFPSTSCEKCGSLHGNFERTSSSEADTISTMSTGTERIVGVEGNEASETPLEVSDLEPGVTSVEKVRPLAVPASTITQDSDSKCESEISTIVEPPDSGFSLTKRLGNAVRNVSSGKRGVAQADGQSRTERLTRSNSAKGNLKLVETPVDAPDAIKLHQVALSRPLPLRSHPIHGQDSEHNPALLPSKRLNGCWITRAEHIDQKSLEQKVEQLRELLAGDGSADEDKKDDAALENGDDRDSPDMQLSTADDDAETSSLPSNQDLTASSTVNHSLREELSLDTLFRVKVFRATSLADFKQVAEVTKTLSDFLELHTAISESLGPPTSPFFHESSLIPRMGEMGNSLASSLGLSTLDTVRLTGTLLCGFLEVPANEVSPEYLECCSNAVCEFLNSMLDAFLPLDGLDALTEFLGISDVSAKEPLPEEVVAFSAKEDTPDGKKLFALSELAMEQLVRAENQAMLATRLAWPRSISASGDGDVSHIIYQPISRHFREAMYGALMKVMEERDEAHARMIAAGVLHAHEMDQQEKSLRRLRLELEAVKKQESRNVSSENVRRAAINMQQDTEAELVSLCQQLASEISSRTSASLEIVRLKESRIIEQENEAAERQALEDELKRTKELLAAAHSKLANSQRQVLNWKESYEEVVRSECASIASTD